MPKINAIVHNRSTIFADGAGQRLPRDEQQQGAGRTLYSAYKTAEEKGELDRIFNKEQLEQSKLHKIKFAEDFAEVFTGTMRDMLSSAIATQHLGIPLWFVHRERSQIKKDLDLRSVKQSTSSSLKDLIDAEKSKYRSLMQLIQGSATGESRDSAVDFPRTCIVPLPLSLLPLLSLSLLSCCRTLITPLRGSCVPCDATARCATATCSARSRRAGGSSRTRCPILALRCSPSQVGDTLRPV